MRILVKRPLRDFWERHPDAAVPLQTWHQRVAKADWATPDQVKADFASASFIANDRVVFNIKGNTYRLVVHIRYRTRRVYIRFIGAHAEYDRINSEEI